jgi:hypothetical protein
MDASVDRSTPRLLDATVSAIGSIVTGFAQRAVLSTDSDIRVFGEPNFAIRRWESNQSAIPTVRNDPFAAAAA